MSLELHQPGGKSCKLLRVKNEPALWRCLTSADQLEFAAILVAKGLLQRELRAAALQSPVHREMAKYFLTESADRRTSLPHGASSQRFAQKHVLNQRGPMPHVAEI